MIEKHLLEYYDSLSYSPFGLASTVIEEAMHGNIPELVNESSFDADGDSDDIGEVHQVYNCRTDKFDAQAALSGDEYRAVLAKAKEQASSPTQVNESQPAADSAE